MKDLGKALGMYVLAINCSEGLDYKAMGHMFSGLAQVGKKRDSPNLCVLTMCTFKLWSTSLWVKDKANVFVINSKLKIRYTKLLY